MSILCKLLHTTTELDIFINIWNDPFCSWESEFARNNIKCCQKCHNDISMYMLHDIWLDLITLMWSTQFQVYSTLEVEEQHFIFERKTYNVHQKSWVKWEWGDFPLHHSDYWLRWWSTRPFCPVNRPQSSELASFQGIYTDGIRAHWAGLCNEWQLNWSASCFSTL